QGLGGQPQPIVWPQGSPKGGEGMLESTGARAGASDEQFGSGGAGSIEGEGSGGAGGDSFAANGGALGGLRGFGEGGLALSAGGAPASGGASTGGTFGAGGVAALGGSGAAGSAQGGSAQGGSAQGGAAQGGAMNGTGGGAGVGGAPCGVFINEVQVGSRDVPADEFVELYNSCDGATSLAGHRLVYRASGGNTDVLLMAFASTDRIAARSFLVLGGAAYSAPAFARWGGGSNGVLAAAAGGLALSVDGSGTVDALGYGNASNAFVEGAAALAPTLGTSIGRVPDGADSNDNWHDFAGTTPTPGAPNK
ncbi:MAG TPA: lamin tail domain-containing protein, partial [Polyangiaceae bacterium]|nr:lamin tail domain-containing protein [Polyangiaceae bacterium]